MPQSIHTDVSESVLQFAPEKGPQSFDITIYNNSSQFASFQVELVAAGAAPDPRNWYRLSPAVSAKIPPGDQTQFQAHLLAVPPIPGGFTGTMNLTVKVYSTELRDEDRKDLRLIILGEGLLPPRVTLPKTTFKANPQDAVEIQARVHNPNRKSLEVVLDLTGLNPAWFPEGTQKSVTLVPAEEKPVTFLCHLPSPPKAPKGVYACGIKLLEPATSAPAQPLQLEILPQGFVDFQGDPLEQWIPQKAGRWLNPFDDTADYSLTFRNQSNLKLLGQVTVVDEDVEAKQPRPRRRLPRLRLPFRPAPAKAPPEETEAALPPGVTLTPEGAIAAPGESVSLALTIRRKLPWLGWPRLKRFQVKGYLPETPLDLRNDTQTLELHILPIIPVWLQLMGGLVGACLLGLGWWLFAQRGHTSAVHTVQFNGTGTEVVSGASDETLRRWRVAGNRLQPRGVIERGDRAMRVVRYRPVNNDWVAIGLENGTIQLRSLVSDQESTLEDSRDDRVFDLVFDQDARSLWSAHGSGVVLRWALASDLGTAGGRAPEQRIEADFAASAVALGGDIGTLLAVGGRYQQFAVVDLDAEEAFEITYPRSGEQTDYINSLEVAEDIPSLLAAGDSDGFVSIWDLEQCANAAGNCDPIDEWLAHGGAAVRSVALSPDGCTLISGGEDGRVQRWSLTGAGERRPEALEGETLHRSSLPINAVDVRQRQRRLWVASGGDDRRVRLDRLRLQASDQCRIN